MHMKWQMFRLAISLLLISLVLMSCQSAPERLEKNQIASAQKKKEDREGTNIQPIGKQP